VATTTRLQDRLHPASGDGGSTDSPIGTATTGTTGTWPGDRRHQPIVDNQIARARRHGDRQAVRTLVQRRRRLPSQDPNDPDYRRLRYVRYADLCRARHKSAYAEARVMPMFLADALVRGGFAGF
jgi:hypothetical protein